MPDRAARSVVSRTNDVERVLPEPRCNDLPDLASQEEIWRAYPARVKWLRIGWLRALVSSRVKTRTAPSGAATDSASS